MGDGVKVVGKIYGKKPFKYLGTPSSGYDASFSSTGEGEEGGSSEQTEDKLFKITGLQHLFNDSLGFITKLSVKESEVATTAGGAGGTGAPGTGVDVGESNETEFTGVAGEAGTGIPIKITNAQWDKEEARQGEVLTLTADVEGASDGTQGEIEIFEHDVDGIQDIITKLPVVVSNNKVETTWEYEYHEDTDEIPNEEELKRYGREYNPPEYFFVVKVGDSEDQSGLLVYKDYIEINLKDEDGEPMANEDYIIQLPDGSEIKGKLDSEGYVKAEGIPPGKVTIKFPNLETPRRD